MTEWLDPPAERLPGYRDGYPLFLSGHLSHARMKDIYTFLQDSGYLNSNQTETLTAELLVYNGDQSRYESW